VAPQYLPGPQPAKHLYFAPSDAQSASAVQIFEHALPGEVQPPSPNVASSRQAPDAQSPSKSHRAPFGCAVIPAVLHAAMSIKAKSAPGMERIGSEATRGF
jgi:hypothetical protein